MIQPLRLGTGSVFPGHIVMFQILEEDQGILAKMKDRWMLGRHLMVLLNLLPCYCLYV